MARRALGSCRWLVALALLSCGLSCGARDIGDWDIIWSGTGGVGGGGRGGEGGDGQGNSGPAPSDECVECTPLVDCAACYIQGEDHMFRCPEEMALPCMYLDEHHVDENGVPYGCYYCN